MYSIDTSYFVEAWKVWYPRAEFEGVWQVLVSAAASKQLFVVDRVYNELAKQVPELVALFDEHAAIWQHKSVDDLALENALNELERGLLAGEIIRIYPPQNIRKYIEVADPAVVLHAQIHGHIVVSNELSDRLTKKGPKIPDLCEVEGVTHATPAQFVSTLGYGFGPRSSP